MLDIKFIRENPQIVKEAAVNKRIKINVDELLEADKNRRTLLQEIEGMRADQKKASSSRPTDAKEISNLKDRKEALKALEEQKRVIDVKFLELMYQIPNIPLSDVPIGHDETQNKVLKKWGDIPQFKFTPKDHLDLGQTLGIIDIQSAAKISGARFSYLKRAGALLEFALINFAFSILTSEKKLKKIADSRKGHSPKPFVPVIPPVMIRPDVFAKMGRLSEEDKEERYYLQKDDLYLVGSAEHTLGPMHMDQTFNQSDLPVRYLGFSTSFRREAGSYGRDTRGILRVHQFDKIEMESFTSPEDSRTEQDFFVAIQEYLMQALEIPYQVVLVCTGEMAKPDARQIDLETWMPGQGKYRETHTSDLMTDFQARRLNTKLRRKDGITEFAHMNDATAFAIGRTLIAILENYQQSDGSVVIPKVLREFVGTDKIEAT